MKQTKTNALRLLDAKKIQYSIYEYTTSDGLLDGVSVAHKTGLPVEQVFKTLITQAGSGIYYVCVVPVADELDLKKASAHFHEKKIEMLPAKDITKITGYIKGGCSPLGMKKLFSTAIDLSAKAFSQIVVSAGRVGLQMQAPLADLLTLIDGQLVDLTKTKNDSRL